MKKDISSNGSENLILDIEGNRICVMVCEDLWNFSSLSVLKSDDIDFLVSIHASPYENKKNFNRINFSKKIAIKYNCNLIYVNTVGGQDEIVFDGSSFLINRNGDLKHHCKKFSEDIYQFSISKKEFLMDVIKTSDKGSMNTKIYMKH